MATDRSLPTPAPQLPVTTGEENNSLIARGFAALTRSSPAPSVLEAERLFAKGMAYLEGKDGLEQDEGLARHYFQEAANLDHPAAQFELSILLGWSEERPDSVRWLEKSSAAGYGPALRYLAENLDEAELAEHLREGPYRADQLFKNALDWYEARAGSGDAECQYRLALMHRSARAPTDDPSQALDWITAAAEQGHVFACLRLGEWLLESKNPTKDLDAAVRWLARAGELGNSYGYKTLGDLYLQWTVGDARRAVPIVERDPAGALAWYERQIEVERARGSFLGTNALARRFLTGAELKQDVVRAEALLTEAALAGNRDAMRTLAREYVTGSRLRRNIARALELLKSAQATADGVKEHDQFDIGQIYETEVEGAPLWPEALTWYRKSAANGGYRAQKALGDLHSQGRGVGLDYLEAYRWYVIALVRTYGLPGIAKWHAAARQGLDELKAKMTSDQIAQARSMAQSSAMQTIENMRPTDRELALEGLAHAS